MLDGGGLFGQRNRKDRDQTAFLCRITGEFGYDAIGLGHNDLNYGLAFLREMIAGHRLPFTNANVRDPATRELLLPPYLIVERGGMRFAVCSVLDPAQTIVTMGSTSEEYLVDDPVATLRSLLPRLRREAQSVILLSHLGDQKTDDLLREIADIDIAVVGRTQRALPGEKVIGRTVVLTAGFEGRAIGRLDAHVDPRDGQVKAFKVGLKQMDETVADDQVISERLLRFKEEQEQKRMSQRGAHQPTLGSPAERFLGQSECKKCHAEAWRAVERSGHMRALATLQRQGMGEEPECLVCHTTGYLYHNGFDLEPPRNVFANVQCEACHGYGTEHRRGADWAAQARAVCTTCHDQKNSPQFDFATYWAKIRH